MALGDGKQPAEEGTIFGKDCPMHLRIPIIDVKQNT
jgi:hypothetical protein